MWTCPTCSETIDASFDICWQCGTSADGAIDPEFRSESNDRANDVSPPPTTQPARFRFSIASILVAMFIVGVALMSWKASPNVFWTAIAATVAANLMGLIAAWFVTNVFELPNDGSLGWDDEEDALDT